MARRAPAAVVESLRLKEGDEMEVAGDRKFQVSRDRTKEEAIASLLSLARSIQPGWRFFRDEGNERNG